MLRCYKSAFCAPRVSCLNPRTFTVKSQQGGAMTSFITMASSDAGRRTAKRCLVLWCAYSPARPSERGNEMVKTADHLQACRRLTAPERMAVDLRTGRNLPADRMTWRFLPVEQPGYDRPALVHRQPGLFSMRGDRCTICRYIRGWIY